MFDQIHYSFHKTILYFQLNYIIKTIIFSDSTFKSNVCFKDESQTKQSIKRTMVSVAEKSYKSNIRLMEAILTKCYL